MKFASRHTDMILRALILASSGFSAINAEPEPHYHQLFQDYIYSAVSYSAATYYNNGPLRSRSKVLEASGTAELAFLDTITDGTDLGREDVWIDSMHGVVMLAFRGTILPDASSVTNPMGFGDTISSLASNLARCDGKCPEVCNNQGCCRVQQTYFEGLDGLLDQANLGSKVQEEMSACRANIGSDCTLIITGHSKGGGVAAAAGIKFRQYDPYVITFGQPPTFTEICKGALNEQRNIRFAGTQMQSGKFKIDNIALGDKMQKDGARARFDDAHLYILGNDPHNMNYQGNMWNFNYNQDDYGWCGETQDCHNVITGYVLPIFELWQSNQLGIVGFSLGYRCGEEGMCRGGLSCYNYKCSDGQAGSSCEQNQHCEVDNGAQPYCDNNNKCSDGELDSRCGDKDHCVSDFQCRKGRCSDGEAGSTCGQHSHCKDGLYCENDDRCRYQKMSGYCNHDRMCSGNMECIDGRCANGWNKSPCRESSDCDSGNCWQRECSNGSDGSTCSQSSDCGRDSFCSGNGSKKDRCEPKRANGEDCGKAKACISGKCSNKGKCKA